MRLTIELTDEQCAVVSEAAREAKVDMATAVKWLAFEPPEDDYDTAEALAFMRWHKARLERLLGIVFDATELQ